MRMFNQNIPHLLGVKDLPMQNRYSIENVFWESLDELGNEEVCCEKGSSGACCKPLGKDAVSNPFHHPNASCDKLVEIIFRRGPGGRFLDPLAAYFRPRRNGQGGFVELCTRPFLCERRRARCTAHLNSEFRQVGKLAGWQDRAFVPGPVSASPSRPPRSLPVLSEQPTNLPQWRKNRFASLSWKASA